MLFRSRNIAVVALIISLFSAMLVYVAIDRIMIGPVRAMTRSMLAFSDAPDDPAYNRPVILPHGASGEKLWREVKRSSA